MNPIFHSLSFDQMANVNSEPFWSEIAPHLVQINQIVMVSGSPLEGNLFYPDGSVPGESPSPMFQNKRQSLALMALMQTKVLEIGFNAGHSALLMLAANPSLELVSIDTGYHAYSQPCADYLRSVYGERFSLELGFSQDLLPEWDLSRFTAFHVDGSHLLIDAAQDMTNIISGSNHGAVIAFDDADTPNLRLMLDALVLTGKIVPLLDRGNQMFFVINQ